MVTTCVSLNAYSVVIRAKDAFVWGTNRFNYTIKSMYLDLMNERTRYLQKYIFKIIIPLKVKIFMWFLHCRVLSTKYNSAKRNWQGSKTCCFCDKESIQGIGRQAYQEICNSDLGGHLCCSLGMCNVRNDFIFSKSRTSTFLEVIHVAIHWSWTCPFIQSAEKRQAMDSRLSRLEMVALSLYDRCGSRLDNRITVWCIWDVSCLPFFVGWSVYQRFVILEL
jgi:hypothetical protein